MFGGRSWFKSPIFPSRQRNARFSPLVSCVKPHASTARQFAERNFVVGQGPDGSWTDNFEGRQIGRVYCTSLALLSLEAKYRRLAICEPQ